MENFKKLRGLLQDLYLEGGDIELVRYYEDKVMFLRRYAMDSSAVPELIEEIEQMIQKIKDRSGVVDIS